MLISVENDVIDNTQQFERQFQLEQQFRRYRYYYDSMCLLSMIYTMSKRQSKSILQDQQPPNLYLKNKIFLSLNFNFAVFV